jgi:hypothetical protein
MNGRKRAEEICAEYGMSARTQLQAFAEACPEVVEVLQQLISAKPCTAERGRAVEAASYLLRRMTAPVTTEEK